MAFPLGGLESAFLIPTSLVSEAVPLPEEQTMRVSLFSITAAERRSGCSSCWVNACQKLQNHIKAAC